jgi:hypothetical protein
MIWGGAFERFPKLKLIHRAGTDWLLPTLQRMG